MNRIKSTLIATALTAAGFAGSAQAAQDTTTFNVRITITESCDISTVAATDVDFGSTARSTAPANATGNLVVNCSTGTPFNIALNAGGNSTSATASATNRRMTDGTNFVPYGLYRDNTVGSFWGDVIGTNTLAGTGTGANVSFPVHARVAAADTNVPAGTYTDAVTATIIY